MPQFEFRGTARSGQVISGSRVAPSRDALDAILRREQIVPTRIVEKGREIAIPKPKVGAKVNAKELAVFTRQFSVMIDAGLPLVQCLEILSSQQENKGFGRALAGVRSSVEAGSSLANAFRQYPKIFDDLYTNMVEAGETGGILDTSCCSSGKWYLFLRHCLPG
jgi:type IV pilus assembly protein PilC